MKRRHQMPENLPPKCVNFDFDWGCAPDPARVYSIVEFNVPLDTTLL